MSTPEEFFSHLDQRFGEARVGETLWLSVMGYAVEVEFRNMLPSDVMRTNLKFFITERPTRVDEKLCVWTDCLDDLLSRCMIPEGERTIHYQQTDRYHIQLPGSYRRLSVRDNCAHVTYICYEHGFATPETCATKPFTNEIQWWLWDDYLLMHGAAVAAGGKGALIAAPSGGGKSTLALAALAQGMDFAGEDFVLMPKVGPAVAHAAFPTGNLLPDSLEMLPEFKSGILTFMESKSKFVVDLSSFGDSFKMSIPLDVMVYPVRCDAAEPSLVPTRSVQLFMMAAVSAAKQVKSRGNLDESVKAVFARLKTLPAYEMRMVRDPRRNARALGDFLMGLSV